MKKARENERERQRDFIREVLDQMPGFNPVLKLAALAEKNLKEADRLEMSKDFLGPETPEEPKDVKAFRNNLQKQIEAYEAKGAALCKELMPFFVPKKKSMEVKDTTETLTLHDAMRIGSVIPVSIKDFEKSVMGILESSKEDAAKLLQSKVLKELPPEEDETVIELHPVPL